MKNFPNLLDELDSLSKIHPFGRDRIDELMKIVGKKITNALNIERLNAWVFNGLDKKELISIGEYDTRDDSFKKGTRLYTMQYPKYFDALHKNIIILAPNIHNHPYTQEFSSNYARQNDVISLMDIPIRIEGNIEGVLCYEKTGKIPREFNEEEQTFALACSQILASNLEARKRRKYQYELEKNLKEKELLIREINHRVKNNLNLLWSICNLYKKNSPNEDCKLILSNIQSDISAISELHDTMISVDQFVSINLKVYLNKIVNNLHKEFHDLNAKFHISYDIPDLLVNSKIAMYLGMIVSEIIQNSIKHLLNPSSASKEINITLKCFNEKENVYIFSIGDDGPGFDFLKEIKKENHFGLDILRGLLENIATNIKYPTPGSAFYHFSLSL